MSKAMEIINNAYWAAGGNPETEYDYPIMNDTMRNNNMPGSIKDFLGVSGRKKIRISTPDLDVVVMEYRETRNELLYVALVEHYIDIVSKLTRRYHDKASAIKYKSTESYGYDDDLASEAIALLDKCLFKYEIYKENSSFTSYYLGVK